VLVKAGDDFSPWLIEQATGQPFDQSAPSLVSNAAMLSITAMLTIILAIVAIFGSLAQVVFMILRGGLLLMLVAVWPLAASMSTTEQGMQWYKKINAYIIAFVLLKPVSAIIYSAGFLLLKGSPGTTGDETTNAITSTLSGLAILGLAGLALPALLRFVTPELPQPCHQGSGHGVCQTGCLDRLTWLFASLGTLLFALDGPSSM
jgi:type IV secretion system protein TrbL